MACTCSNSSSSSSCSSCNTSPSCSVCSNGNLPITVYRGSSFAPIIRLVDSSTGLPIDTTPYTEIAVSVCGVNPPTLVTVLFSAAQVLKIAPNSSGQIKPLFTGANTTAFGLTDATQAAACNYTSIKVTLTDPTNPAQNPFVLVIPNALNILDSSC